MKWRYSFCIWQHHLIFLNLLIRFYPKENPQITISATLLFTLFMMNYNQVAASDCQSNGDILFLTFAFALSCLILCHPMDYSLPGSSVHGNFQARILELVAISFSRGPSQPRDRALVSHTTDRVFIAWATKEASSKVYVMAKWDNLCKVFRMEPRRWNHDDASSFADEETGQESSLDSIKIVMLIF